MHEWPAPVRAYLAALVDRSAAILGPELVGVYAAGSLALNAYEPGRSDIDIAVVCAGELALPVKRSIVEALRQDALPCPARGLELVVYRAAVARAGTAEPGFEVELNTGPRMDFRATYSGADRQPADGTFWYAIDRSILAERGRELVGPPAALVFRSVPEDVLLALLIESLRWHLWAEIDDPEMPDETPAAWTDDAVLNACRALRRATAGLWVSKTEAGRRLLAELRAGSTAPDTRDGAPDPVVIGQALAARTGGTPPGIRPARQFQREVLAALHRLLGS